MSAQNYLILDPSFLVKPDKLEKFGEIEDFFAEGGSKPEIILPSIFQSIDPELPKVADLENTDLGQDDDLRDVLTAWGVDQSKYDETLKKLLDNKQFNQFFKNPDRRERIRYPNDLRFIPPEKLGKNSLHRDGDVYKFLSRAKTSATDAVKETFWEIISLSDKFKASIVVCNKKFGTLAKRAHIPQWGFYGAGGIAIGRFIIDKLPAEHLAEISHLAPEPALLLLSSLDQTGISLALWMFQAARRQGVFEQVKEFLSEDQEQSKERGCIIRTPYQPPKYKKQPYQRNISNI